MSGWRITLALIRPTIAALAAVMPLRSRGIFHPRCVRFAALPMREGAGKTGCLLHPRSRVQFCANKNGTRAYRYRRSIPAFPAQWLYGLLRALRGERLFCLRRPRFITRAWRQHRGARTTRLHRTHQARASRAPDPSTASHPAFVTCARPSHRVRRAERNH